MDVTGTLSKSWFNRISGVAERHFARGVTALKKLAVPEARLLDYQDCKGRVEKMAAENRGADRLEAMRRWVEILVEQGKHPVVQPVMLTRPASPSHPDHEQKDGEEDEEDWQQLSALPSSSASGYLDKERAAGVGPAMYVDRGVEAGEPMSFRELFLRSNALESIIAGYSEEPPSSQEEEELLTQLVNACFGSSETENEELLRDVMALSRAQGQCKESGVAAGNIRAVSRNVVEAVKDLKRQAAAEVLEGKMGSLREEVAEQAATAALLHKFNSGASEPTGKVTRQRLVQGLLATKEVMALGEALCQLAVQHSRIVGSPGPSHHAELIDELQTRASHLALAVSKAEEKLEDNQQQRQDSQGFREQKVKEMEGVWSKVQEEIQGLQAERAVLLAELEKLDLFLTKAQAHRADLEEGRNVFDEGTAFTIQGLEHEADKLCGLQNQHEAEIAALAKCRQLVGRASFALEKKRREEQKEASLAVLSAAEEHSHAATRHLYFQRAQLQLLLRQLIFCASELSGLADKQSKMSRLGMEVLLPDVALQRHRLMHQYLDAECASQHHIQQVAEVCHKLEAVVEQASTAVPDPVPSNQEFENLAKSIHDMKLVFTALSRPEGLPAAGEKLPPILHAGQHRPDSAPDSKASSRVLSATCSHLDAIPANEGTSNPQLAVQSPTHSKAKEEQHDLGLDRLLDGDDSTASISHASEVETQEITPASSLNSAVSVDDLKLQNEPDPSPLPASETHQRDAQAPASKTPKPLSVSEPPEVPTSTLI